MEFHLSRDGLLVPVVKPRGGPRAAPLPSYNPPFPVIPVPRMPQKIIPPIIETSQHPATAVPPAPPEIHESVPEPPQPASVQSMGTRQTTPTHETLAAVSQAMRASRTRIGTIPTNK